MPTTRGASVQACYYIDSGTIGSYSLAAIRRLELLQQVYVNKINNLGQYESRVTD